MVVVRYIVISTCFYSTVKQDIIFISGGKKRWRVFLLLANVRVAFRFFIICSRFFFLCILFFFFSFMFLYPVPCVVFCTNIVDCIYDHHLSHRVVLNKSLHHFPSPMSVVALLFLPFMVPHHFLTDPSLGYLINWILSSTVCRYCVIIIYSNNS